MKKRVFIGVLAALMLFAFVACDNSTPVATYKDVSYVSVEQVKDFIVGEPITADGFQIVVNYTTGNPTVISGNAGTIDVSDSEAVTATKSVEFKNVNGDIVPVIPCETEYKTVTGVSISGVTSATMNEEVTLAALSDIVTAIENKTLVIEGTPVITFSYDGGSKQYTLKDLEEDNLDVVLSLVNGSTVADTSTDFKADETWAVSLDKYRFAASGAWADEFVPGLSTGLSINVVAKSVQVPATITSIEVLYTVTGSRDKNGTITADQSVLTNGTLAQLTAADLYFGDKVTYTVNAVYSDSTEETPHKQNLTYNAAFGTANSYQIISSSEGFVDGAQSVKTAQQTAAIRYYDAETGKVLTENITIPVGAATVTGSSVSVAQDKTKNISANTQITTANIGQYVTVSGLSVIGRTSATVTTSDYSLELPWSVTLDADGTSVPVVLKYNSYGTEIREAFNVPFEVVSSN